MASGVHVPDLEMEELETPSAQTSEDSQSEETLETSEGAEEAKPKRYRVPDVETPSTNELTAVLAENNITTRAQFDQLVQATRQHVGLLNLLQSDPRAFFSKVGEFNPQMRAKLVSIGADMFLEDNDPGDEPAEGQGRGGRSRATTSGASPEVTQLNARLSNLEAELNGRRAAETYSNLRQAFNGKIDSYLGVKELDDLTGKDKKAVKALLLQSLAEDGDANARIQQGNFKDIPKHLNKVLDDWTADTVGASEAEEASREKVRSGAVKSVVSGAVNVGGLSENDTNRADTGDMWEDAALEIGRDLNRAKAKAKSRK